ncbi:MAG TPA: hypothetical protein VIJ22_19925 [Polyangiaceae bacterium]
MNPYANYGASTSRDTAQGSREQPAESRAPYLPSSRLDRDPGAWATTLANDEAALRRQIADAIIAGDDARADELRATLHRPVLRVVKA